MKQPKVIFFIKNRTPTAAEVLEASKIGAKVVMRCAKFVGSKVEEPCDGVAGSIPTAYQKHATADEAVEAYQKALAESAEAMTAKAKQFEALKETAATTETASADDTTETKTTAKTAAKATTAKKGKAADEATVSRPATSGWASQA